MMTDRAPGAEAAAAPSPAGGEPLPATLFGREPLLYLALVKAALVLVVAFGFDLGLEQTAAILLLAEAALAFLARSQVTPVEAPRPLGVPLGSQGGHGGQRGRGQGEKETREDSLPLAPTMNPIAAGRRR